MITIQLLAQVVCLVARSQSVNLPVGAETMLDGRDAGLFRLLAEPRTNAVAQASEVADLEFPSSVRVQVRSAPERADAVRLVAAARGSVAPGDVLALELFVRGTAARSEALTAYGIASVEEPAGAFRRLGGEGFYAGANWRQVFVAFRAQLAAENPNVVLHLGTYAQSMEIGGVRLLNYRRTRALESLPRSPVAYSGMELDAPWREAAEERIERLRKGRFTIRVIDAQGRPVEKAKVHVRMKRHAFGFGTAVTARQLAAEGEDADRYRHLVENYFNRVVFEKDLKWEEWERSKSNTDPDYRQQYLEAACEWLRERTIGVRGHYGAQGPLDREGLGPGEFPESELPRRLIAHLEEKFTAVGDKVIEWDVLNHPVADWMPTLERRFGIDLYAEIFRRAHERVPSSISVWANESGAIEGGGRRAEFERVLHDLVAKGADITGVGFMGHFDPASVRGIEEMYADFDRFAAIVGNLQITGLDFDTTDEALQARYLADAITIAFSHTNFCGILQWGFWEGQHWRPDAALWRKDWSIKPAGQAYLDLVYRKWWTDEIVETGANGLVSLRGFLGAYEIAVGTTVVSTQLIPDGTWVDVPLP